MHFWVDKSRRRIRLDVKYVITATFLCPRGGVNAGSNMLLEMIHSMTHAVKRHRENVPLRACHSGEISKGTVLCGGCRTQRLLHSSEDYPRVMFL